MGNPLLKMSGSFLGDSEVSGVELHVSLLLGAALLDVAPSHPITPAAANVT